MAPNFLTKLVKSTNNRERRSSETEAPRSSVVVPRRQSISQSNVISPTTPTQATILNSQSTPVSTPTIVTDNIINKAPSADSLQPNVTIVPPSPLVQDTEISEDDDDNDNDDNDEKHSVNIAATPTSKELPSMPTPTPPSGKLSNGKANPAMTSNASLAPKSANSLKISKKLSSQSMKSVKEGGVKKVPSELNLNVIQFKTAGSPADVDSDFVTQTPIVDSPTDIKAPPATTPATPASAPEKTNGGSVVNLAVQRQNTDTASVSGKRPWSRSTARKPTGLASAIAASGLAMANPALSVSHQAQLPPPTIISPQRSSSSSKKTTGTAPYMSISPAQSRTSQRHSRTRSGELSPKQLKPKKSTNGMSLKGSRPRKSSVSVNSDNGSEYYAAGRDEVRQEYYSGLERSSDDDGTGSDLDSDLELGDDNIPVTGFAVASNKRNADFHELFPTVPEGDYLIEDYGCALQREILIQGRLYISENHICFHANIFGWITDLSIPIYEITTLDKKMTAFVIPNAIQLSTRQAKYTFASFLSRDTTFDVIYNIWRLARPEDGVSIGSRGRSSMDGPDSGASAGTLGTAGAAGIVAGVQGGVVAPLRRATLCACGKAGQHYSETALDTVIPGTPDRIHNLMFASGFMKDFMSGNQKLLDIQMSDWSPVTAGSKLLTRNMSYIKPLTASLGPKQTKCEITDETVHLDFDDYISTVTTTRTPDVPSGGVFAVKTKTCVMWASPVSSRVIVTTQVEWTGRSFIKGIIERSAIDGQKVYHSDLENAMRLYIQEHQSEFLPEGVDPVVIDITAALPETIVSNGVPDSPTDKRHIDDEFKQRERERNQRGLQWAWDTFGGAFQVAKQSTQGALELVRDAWDQSSSTTILWFVIVILMLSNVWTLMRMGASRDEASRRLENRKVEEREKWVQSIVTALWEELSTGKGHVLAETVFQQQHQESLSTVYSTPSITRFGDDIPVETSFAEATTFVGIALETPVTMVPGKWQDEVERLQETLDAVEKRVKDIRESLISVQNLDSLD